MEFGQPPRIVEEGPQGARGPRRRRSTRGDQGDCFFRESPPGRGLPDRGDVQHEAASAAGRAVWKGRSGDPPRSRPRSGSPPSFLRLPGCVGVTLICASPPEARPSRRMARGVPKGPNRRFDRRSYRLQRRAGGGGRTRPGGRRELFPFRNPAPTLRNLRLLGVQARQTPAKVSGTVLASIGPLGGFALRIFRLEGEGP